MYNYTYSINTTFAFPGPVFILRTEDGKFIEFTQADLNLALTDKEKEELKAKLKLVQVVKTL